MVKIFFEYDVKELSCYKNTDPIHLREKKIKKLFIVPKKKDLKLLKTELNLMVYGQRIMVVPLHLKVRLFSSISNVYKIN